MSLRDLLTFESMCVRLSAGPRRFIVLVRHFFIRFFLNDVFPFEEQMKEKLYIVLAMLSALGWLLATTVFGQYIFVADNGESWLQKCEFLSAFMVLLVFITLLEWDVVFLDRRDFVNLAGLPLRTGTLFRAKFVSFLYFVGLYALAANALSAVAIGFFLPQWIGNSVGSLVRYMAAHVVATTLACYFSFFLILSLEAVLLLVLSPRLFRTVSLVVRSVLAIGCVAFLTAFAFEQNVLSRVFEGLAELRQSRPAAALAVPPVWFVGIYEKLIGRGNPFYDVAAWRGIAALLGLAGFVFFALSWSYRKHMRKSIEVRTRRRSFRPGRERIQDVFDGLFLRHPVQRAIFHFFGKTLRNSPRQKIRLAGSLAVATGFLIVLLIRLHGFPRTVGAAEANVLAIPLILAIALLLGLRTGVNIPLSAEANWIFRLTESPVRRHYFSALKKAVFVFALLPLALVLFGGHAVLWGVGPAALHILYGLSCTLVFCEVFFWRYAKIPFSCLVVPGKTQIQKYWLLYFLAFILTVSLFSVLERTLIRTPSSFPVFFGIAGALLTGMIVYQRFEVYEKLPIVYEEEPEPVMVTL